jgi:general secretion pathway protein C
MAARLTSLLIWAVVAATAVAWGLRLTARPQPVPPQAVTAGLTPPAGSDLVRLLGTPPPAPVAAEVAVPADSRFKLLGVVAPRAGQVSSGLALVSVDGKPARAVAVGREVEPGLRLLRVDHRQADFGAQVGTPPSMSLTLPPLAEAARGRLGDGPAPVAVMPGALGAPGLPGQNLAAPGLPRVLGVPALPAGAQRPGTGGFGASAMPRPVGQPGMVPTGEPDAAPQPMENTPANQR